jgi:uncharacterized membrane protein YcjF (UPF0283 family)
MANDTPTPPRFVPPPWEQEAFERFRDRQEEPPARPAHETAEAPRPRGLDAPAPSEAAIDAMLVELRAEEPPARAMSSTAALVVSAGLAITGALIVIQSALLFSRTRTADAAAAMLATAASLVVLVAGVGFLVGAALLFRKYHR